MRGHQRSPATKVPQTVEIARARSCSARRTKMKNDTVRPCKRHWRFHFFRSVPRHRSSFLELQYYKYSNQRSTYSTTVRARRIFATFGHPMEYYSMKPLFLAWPKCCSQSSILLLPAFLPLDDSFPVLGRCRGAGRFFLHLVRLEIEGDGARRFLPYHHRPLR